jgi:hypothetical protein
MKVRDLGSTKSIEFFFNLYIQNMKEIEEDYLLNTEYVNQSTAYTAINAQTEDSYKYFSVEEPAVEDDEANAPSPDPDTVPAKSLEELFAGIGLVETNPEVCCKAMNAGCLACSQGVSVEEFCENPANAKFCQKKEDTYLGSLHHLDVSSEYDGVCVGYVSHDDKPVMAVCSATLPGTCPTTFSEEKCMALTPNKISVH